MSDTNNSINNQNMIEESSNEYLNIDIISIFRVIWNTKKFIAGMTTVFVILGISYALFAKQIYEARISLYPSGEQKSSSLNKFKGLASAFGMGGTSSTTNFYIPDVIKSRSILEKIILKKWKSNKYKQPVNLLTLWKLDSGDNINMAIEFALENITKSVSYNVDDDSGLITVSVGMSEGQLAADIANYIGEEVNRYIKEEQLTSAKISRGFIEQRLKTVMQELKDAEESLKNFMKTNRMVTESPELQIEMARLRRAVEVKNQVYITLEQQKEMAMIDEIKQMPVMNILDKAVKPEIRTKPKRKKVVIMSFVAGIFFSIFYAVFADFMKKFFISRSFTPPRLIAKMLNVSKS